MKSNQTIARKLLLAAAAGSMMLSSLGVPVMAQEEMLDMDSMDETSASALPAAKAESDSSLARAEEDSEKSERSKDDAARESDKKTESETGLSTQAESSAVQPGSGTVYEWKQLEVTLQQQIASSTNEAQKQALQQQLASVQKILATFERTAMYRLYNPNSGEHFYTEDVNERDTLSSLGWKDEGIGWYAPVNGGKDVYRLYNPSGDHHYTLDANERDTLVSLGWKDEGVGWKSFDGAAVNAAPLYRQYNPNEFKCNHNYTASVEEARALIGYGWKDEGVGWYGIQPFQRVESEDGFRFIDGSTLEPLTGLQTIDGATYYLDPAQNGLAVSGPVEVNGKVFVFGDNGQRMSGLVNYGGKTYWLDGPQNSARTGLQLMTKAQTGSKAKLVYFLADGSMARNMDVDGMQFGNDGALINPGAEDRIMLDCLNLYDTVGTDLRSCFDWTWQNIRYKAFSPQWVTPPADRTYEQNFALMGLEQQTGNCYVFASTMVYLARNLGYTARLARGTIKTVNGEEEHGWCEILQDGKWYICDGSFAQGFKPEMCFMQPKERPTFIYTCSWTGSY